MAFRQNPEVKSPEKSASAKAAPHPGFAGSEPLPVSQAVWAQFSPNCIEQPPSSHICSMWGWRQGSPDTSSPPDCEQRRPGSGWTWGG